MRKKKLFSRVIFLTIDFGEPVILEYSSVEEPGHKVAL
jgi:hypothetical protein